MSQEENPEELRNELEKQKELISEFSSVVSHDLRNPLNLAKGYLDLAKETGDEEDFNEVKKALDRMEEIIEHIIYMARKPEKIEKEEINLREVFKEAWNDLDTAEATYQVENIKFNADKANLKNMLEKMISNSIEHNKEEIEITVGSLNNGFFFEDNGNGIETTDKKIFEYGFSTKENNAGFGMSVVKRVSEAHNWDYELKNSEEGGLRLEFKFND